MDLTVVQPFLDAHKENISQYTTLDAKLKAAEGDLDKALQAWMETSEDETAVKLRQAIAEAQKRLKTLAEANVKTENLSDDEKEKIRTELSTLKDTIRSGKRAIERVASTFNLDLGDVLAEMGDPTKGASAGTGVSTGSSLPRANVMVTVYNDVKPDSKTTFENLGKAALFIGIDLQYLQELFAEAGGVEHKDISQIKEPTKFKVPQQPNSQVTWTVETEPKETKPRGRKAVKDSGTDGLGSKDPAELPAEALGGMNKEENQEEVA